MPLRARPFLLLLALHAPYAVARTCALSIGADDQMQFSTAELRVAPDCTRVELTLRHTGTRSVTAMGHNWVLARSEDVRAIAIAGQRAGAAAGYLPRDDARIVARTTLEGEQGTFRITAGGGQSTRISFPTAALRRGGDYTFFCSFPGHWNVMKGRFVFG